MADSMFSNQQRLIRNRSDRAHRSHNAWREQWPARRLQNRRMTGSNCLPVAVIAYNDFPRIGAQRGVFTLFPERRSAITDDTLEGTCRSFVIPREHKEKILRELKFVCIDEYSSYPDLDHLGKRIAYSHMRSKTSLWETWKVCIMKKVSARRRIDVFDRVHRIDF